MIDDDSTILLLGVMVFVVCVYLLFSSMVLCIQSNCKGTNGTIDHAHQNKSRIASLPCALVGL